MSRPREPGARRGYTACMIDGHLDLAYNVLAAGRDLTLPLEELRREHPGALVTLPERALGGGGIVCGTIFVMPTAATLGGGVLKGRSYETPDEARALALEQLELYERWEDEGRIRILRRQRDLEPYTRAGDGPTGLVLLMEGADPLRTPDDLAEWTARGLRVVGPAWQRTRYAGGTRAPGPLTDLGLELMHALKQENLFLDPEKAAPNSATLQDVTRHAEHVAGLIGWDKLAVGTDWDGGFGADDVPAEVTRAADFARLGEAVPEAVRAGFLGGTWLKFLQRALPE